MTNATDIQPILSFFYHGMKCNCYNLSILSIPCMNFMYTSLNEH